MIIFSPLSLFSLGLPAEMEAKPEVGMSMLHQTWHRETLILPGPWEQEQHNGQHHEELPEEAEQRDQTTRSRLNTTSLRNHRGNLGKQIVITWLGPGPECQHKLLLKPSSSQKRPLE